MINFPTWIWDYDSQSHALLDFFFLLMLEFVLHWLSFIGKFWSCCCLNFHWLSIKFTTGSPFYHTDYDYSHADWDGFHNHLRDVPWEDIFKLSASTVASKFCEWIQVGIDVYTPYCKYQVKPHSPPWFSAACAATIVHRNHFFCFYKKNKSSESKGTFRQASNLCKRVLEAAKLAYANKTKESITSQKLGSLDLWQIANSVLNQR